MRGLARCVFEYSSNLWRRIVLGIHTEAYEFESIAEIACAVLNLGHLPRELGANGGATRENEVCDPNVILKIFLFERFTKLVHQSKALKGPQARQLGRRGRRHGG